MLADFQLHGEQSFQFRIVEIVNDADQLLPREAALIQTLKADGLAYNASDLNGRPKSPCAKCGGTERNATGQCIPCNREYMRKYRKRWVAERRKQINERKET